MKKIKAYTLYLWTAIIGLSFCLICYTIGAWFPIMYGILALGVLSAGVCIYLKKEALLSFFKNKSTHNVSYHYSIIFLGFLVFLGVNFLAAKYNKTFDITSDKINTLSSESLKVVKALDKETSLKVYYIEDTNTAQIKLILKKLFGLYERESVQIKSEFINAKWEPSAAEYLTKEDGNKISIYVDNGTKKEKVIDPISEETITSAMIRLNSNVKHKVYFTTGHGEKSTADEAPEGLGEFRKSLITRGLDTAALSLLNLKNGEMPKDLYALVIAGPIKPFSEVEKDILKAYVEDGGRLLVALDPEFMTGFDDLFNVFGITLKKDYIVSVQSLVPLFVMGSEFSKISEITSEFVSSQVMFPISGSIAVDYKKVPKGVKVEPLVSTNEYSFSARSSDEVQKTLQKISEKNEMSGQSFDIAVSISGKAETHDDMHAGHEHQNNFKKGDGFSIVLFSDSDFISNEHISQFFNKDLALNSVVYLTGQKNLISVRPNQAKPTTIELTSMGLNIAALMSFSPFLFFAILSIVFWFRKRSL